MKLKSIPLLLLPALMLVLAGCGGGISESDINATVEAKVEQAKASLVAPTAVPLPTYTPAPIPTPLPTYTPLPTDTPLAPLPTYTPLAPLPTYTPLAPLPTYTPLAPLPTYTPLPTPTPQVIIKEVIVEKIVKVVVTATPTSEPTPVTTDTVYEWEEISAEYEVNALVANSKYLNQTISIRGTVSRIDYRYFSSSMGIGEDLPTVSFAASWDAGRNHLLCGLDSLDKVMNLSVGDTVIVTGTIVGWDGTWLYVYPCS